MSTYKLVCPACGGAIRVRTTEGQTPCFRSAYYECVSLICGAKFSGSVTIDYQLSPSGLEKPLIQLPIAPALERMKAKRVTQVTTNQPDMLDQLLEESA